MGHAIVKDPQDTFWADITRILPIPTDTTGRRLGGSFKFKENGLLKFTLKCFYFSPLPAAKSKIMKDVAIYIHGKNGSAQEVARYRRLFADSDVPKF